MQHVHTGLTVKSWFTGETDTSSGAKMGFRKREDELPLLEDQEHAENGWEKQ